jgi:DNA-binding response OmpR family regulator
VDPASSSLSRVEAASFVVLIEDNPTDVLLVREAISAHDLNVELDLMEDGEQAIRFIAEIDANPQARCPQLFLLDLNLPKVSGVEVLGSIRRSNRCANCPVLVITSSDAQNDRARSTALGATAYFRKPSGYEAYMRLGEVIQQLLT